MWISTVRARPGLLAISRVLFASVFLVVTITTTLVTFIMPESFVSQARIALRPDATDAAGTPGLQGAPGLFDARFVQTECEVMRSERILAKAIDDLDLNKEWGKQFANGERLKTSETMTLLRGRVDLRPIPNTSAIELRVFDEKPDEAARVNAIAEAYRDRRAPLSQPHQLTALLMWRCLACPPRPPAPGQPVPAASVSGGPRVEILDRAVPGFGRYGPTSP